MKSFMKIISLVLLLLLFVSCSSNNKINNTTYETNITQSGDEIMNKALVLKIDNKEVEVNWNDNESIKDLKSISKNGLNINMSKYGGFEQVGSLGQKIKSNDTRITTEPGDIVLYSSNQIVIFYGSNTWEYTKLGHINLTKDELTILLGNDDVVINIGLK